MCYRYLLQTVCVLCWDRFSTICRTQRRIKWSTVMPHSKACLVGGTRLGCWRSQSYWTLTSWRTNRSNRWHQRWSFRLRLYWVASFVIQRRIRICVHLLGLGRDACKKDSQCYRYSCDVGNVSLLMTHRSRMFMPLLLQWKCEMICDQAS